MKRRAIAVSGIVQGVGFRPFVYGLAARLGLHGFVKNQTGGVLIEVEGEDDSLDRFLDELTARPPRLAQIENVCWESCRPRGDREFRIESSTTDATQPIFPAPDVATCDDCLAELFDPRDRRYRYPFLNCTHCGPRLTIIRGTPYDRERTTMASFTMCPACRAEYEDPSEPPLPRPADRLPGMRAASERCATQTATPARVRRPAGGSRPRPSARARSWRSRAWAATTWPATRATFKAVADLRIRKHRDEKPFALMVRDLAWRAAARGDFVSARRRFCPRPRVRSCCWAAERARTRWRAVAPGNPCLGVMLPYTPLHHLLLEALEPLPLVMTSGNRSDEPIAYDDGDAERRLAGIADLFLTHDRPIQIRCDDSVTRVVAGIELPVRRSRGYAPQPIRLPVAVPPADPGGRGTVEGDVRPRPRAARRPQPSHRRPRRLRGLPRLRRGHRALRAALRHRGPRSSRTTCTRIMRRPGTRASVRSGSAPDLLSPFSTITPMSPVAWPNTALSNRVIGVALRRHWLSAATVRSGAANSSWPITASSAGRRTCATWPCPVASRRSGSRGEWRRPTWPTPGWTPPHFRIVSPLRRSPTVRRQIERRFNAPLTSSMGRLFDAVAALAGVRDGPL